jgi:hypothetical protein
VVVAAHDGEVDHAARRSPAHLGALGARPDRPAAAGRARHRGQPRDHRG